MWSREDGKTARGSSRNDLYHNSLLTQYTQITRNLVRITEHVQKSHNNVRLPNVAKCVAFLTGPATACTLETNSSTIDRVTFCWLKGTLIDRFTTCTLIIVGSSV